MNPLNAELKQTLEQAFVTCFGDAEGVRYFFSPSRINIIGEHIDYNGGVVFPCAIGIGTYGVARPNGRQLIRLKTLNFNHYAELEIPFGAYDDARGWVNYTAGVGTYLADRGHRVEGFDLLVYGDIPNGSGLSSSASLELLIGEVINALFNGNRIERLSLVHAGVWCENSYFGLHTGIMDQYVIGFGKRDHALVLNTGAQTHEYVPFELPGAKIVILNTQKRRELKDSKYNERREECERALALLRAHREITYLCELGEDDLPLVEALEDEVLRRRARHVVTENLRVQAAIRAMNAGDLEQLGRILREGQRSLSEDYEVSGRELDAITEAANRHPGCYGARMTGAGFGGCGIALVREDMIDDFIEQVGASYLQAVGYEAQFIRSTASDGTGVCCE